MLKVGEFIDYYNLVGFMSKRINRNNFVNYITGYSFVIPPLIFVVLFIMVPVFKSFYLSFTSWRGLGEPSFTGLSNYINLFTKDPAFYIALKNSLLFQFGATAGTILVGLILALLIDLKIRFWRFYRFVFFLPVVLSTIAIGFMWQKVFDPYGLLNTILEALTLDRFVIVWLGQSQWLAMGIIVFVTIWQYSGFPMLFFLAGLQNIDPEIYEAARIDGASTIKRIIHVSIPLLKNVFSVIIVLQLIFSFKVFGIVWVMTQGGPANLTEVLGTHLYKVAFTGQSFGYGSVIAVLIFIVSMIYAYLYTRISGYKNTLK